jgi:putative Ca2+/H+ antiporter (TMEM165/GDT1 family)
MIQDILVPLVAVGLAELGDKTQLAVLALASKTKKHLQLLLGVILAFFIADGLAVILGNFITNIIPGNIIKVIAGIIFIVFGVIILMNNKEEEEKIELKNPFASGFLLILISEMGDKTQIAAALFATKYNPILVLIGIMIALTALSLLAIYLGKIITKKVNKRIISKAAGTLFIILGILSFL